MDDNLCKLPPHLPRVTEDPEVMGGAPCFAETRVPVAIVLASLDAGITWTRLVESYPFLTEAHVSAGREFAAAHPAKLNPREDGLSCMPVVSTKVVRRNAPGR